MHVRTERHADRSKGHRLSAGYALQVLSKDVYVHRVRLARWGDAQAHHCKVLHISAVVPLFPFHLKHIVWYTHSVVAQGAHTGRSRATCREPAYAGDHSRVGGTGIGTWSGGHGLPQTGRHGSTGAIQRLGTLLLPPSSTGWLSTAWVVSRACRP